MVEAGYEAEEARVIDAGRQRQDLLRRPGQHLRGRLSILRRPLHELVLQGILEIPLPGAFAGQAVQTADQEFGDHAGQPEHLVTLHMQIVGAALIGPTRPLAFAALCSWRPLLDAHPGNLSATSLPGRPTCTTMCCCPSWLYVIIPYCPAPGISTVPTISPVSLS